MGAGAADGEGHVCRARLADAMAGRRLREGLYGGRTGRARYGGRGQPGRIRREMDEEERVVPTGTDAGPPARPVTRVPAGRRGPGWADTLAVSVSDANAAAVLISLFRTPPTMSGRSHRAVVRPCTPGHDERGT